MPKLSDEQAELVGLGMSQEEYDYQVAATEYFLASYALHCKKVEENR